MRHVALASLIVAPLLWSSTALAATVTITSPAAGSTWGDAVIVNAEVVPGPGVLSKVRASVTAAATVDMTSIGSNRYTATIVLKGTVPWGPQTLTVTAIDIDGATSSATRSFVHDENPVVYLKDFPTNGYLPPGPVHFRLTCEDDNPAGCTSVELGMTVDGEKKVLATGTSVIDTTIDLSSYAGKLVSFTQSAGDSAGHSYTIHAGRKAYQVTNAPPLCEYATPPAADEPFRLFSGGVLDADDDRVLLGLPARIVDRNTGVVTTVTPATDGSTAWGTGLLIPGGAVMCGRTSAGSTGQGLVFLPNGFVAGGASARAAFPRFSVFGNWVLPYGSPENNVPFDTGTASLPSTFTYAVGPKRWPGSADSTTGARCIAASNVIELVSPSDAVVETITLDPAIVVHECIVDEGNVVYRFWTPTPPPTNHWGLAMVDKAGASTTLVPEAYSTYSTGGDIPNLPTFPGDGLPRLPAYGIAGDWVHFWADGKLWRRSPAGTIAAATGALTGSNLPRVLAMAPTGELLVQGSPDGTITGYGLHRVPGGATLSASTRLATDPFGAFGTAFHFIWRSNRWLLVDVLDDLEPAGSAWLLNDGPTKPYKCAPQSSDGGADGSADGVPDGGAPDAGASAPGANAESPPDRPDAGAGDPAPLPGEDDGGCALASTSGMRAPVGLVVALFWLARHRRLAVRGPRRPNA